MNLFKKLDLLLGSFGNIKAMERNHVDVYTENRIATTVGEKIAFSATGGIWIEHQELAGFNFINCTFITKKSMKTLKGCRLDFSSEKSLLLLNSDTLEIDSDYSNVSNRWISHVAFDVTNLDLNVLENKLSEKITLYFNNEQEVFSTLK